MDFRTQHTVEALAEALGIKGSSILGMRGSFDRLSVQGGAANFSQLEAHLTSAKRLHGCASAILTIHENCGAGAKMEDLRAAAVLAAKLGYKTRLFYIKLAGVWEEVQP